jgi:hypothetical protein
MNIIFGDVLEQLPDNYTVLELDTFRRPDNSRFTAYCVVESMPVTELAQAEHWLKIHQDLMANYRAREWNYCEHAIEGLTGRWSGEADSFYLNLLERVRNFQTNPPSAEWDGSILKIG